MVEPEPNETKDVKEKAGSLVDKLDQPETVLYLDCLTSVIPKFEKQVNH